MDSNYINEIVKKYGADNKQQFKQVIVQLLKLSQKEIIDVLFECFYLDYQTQDFAGKLLLHIKPNCDDHIVDKILCVLNSWDFSVEQLPYYLVAKYNKTKALELLEGINRNNLNDKETKALSTMLWWIQGYKSNNSYSEIVKVDKCKELLTSYKKYITSNNLYDDLLSIISDRNRWIEARNVFDNIRKEITLKIKDTNSLDYIFAVMAENCAKFTYNASDCAVPYDKNVYARILQNEKEFVELINKKSG